MSYTMGTRHIPAILSCQLAFFGPNLIHFEKCLLVRGDGTGGAEGKAFPALKTADKDTSSPRQKFSDIPTSRFIIVFSFLYILR